MLESLGFQRLPNLDVDGDDDLLDFRSRFFVSYQIPESDSVREVVHEVAAPARTFINSANRSQMLPHRGSGCLGPNPQAVVLRKLSTRLARPLCRIQTL